MHRNLIVMLCAMFPLQAAAGVVRGEISPGAWDTLPSGNRADPAFWRLGPAPAKKAAVPEAFVVLEGTEATNLPSEADQKPVIKLEGYGFWPSTVVVRVGSSLTIQNQDPRAYSCQAKGSSDAFAIEELKAGGQQVQKFLSKGVLKLRCAGYPFMQATVLVVESPLVARLDPRGAFDFKGVPEGKYKARVYTKGAWRWENDVRVQGAGVAKVELGPATKPAPDQAAAPADDKGVEPAQPDRQAPQPDITPPASEHKPPAVDHRPAPVDKRPPQADKKPPKADKKPPKADKKPPRADEKPLQADKKPPRVDEKPPKADKKPPKADKKPPKADKKPPQADKKPPKADEKPPKKKDAEPAFKDVEPEIEIEIED